jgi:hypothetical protein
MQTATQLYKVDVELYDYKVHKKIVDIVKPKTHTSIKILQSNSIQSQWFFAKRTNAF